MTTYTHRAPTSAEISDAVNSARELAHVARELPTAEAQHEAYAALQVFIGLAAVPSDVRARMTAAAEGIFHG